MDSLERESATFFHTYKRIPLEIEAGEGVYLFTRDGQRYLDMFSGLAVNALGYGHPRILQAIQEQSRKFIHLSNYYLQEPQLQLAELLTKYSGFSKVFFSNSGTEAIEGTIKLCRKWGAARGKTEIISFTNAFHGRTMGALSMMDRPKYRNGFEPFLEHFRIVQFNNIRELHRAVSERTLAVMLEFIQGEGGIRPVTQEFVDGISDLKSKSHFLVVADEIQSGIGRTGKLFGFQHFNIQPDVVVVAKPIGGGLPLGAILGSEAVADVLEPGLHGTTFGGNPVACAAGVVVLREIMEGGLMSDAEKMGRLLKSKLSQLQTDFPSVVKEVRGLGLMLGVELYRDAEPFVAAMRGKGILINGTDQTVLRFLPPLIVQEHHIEETIKALRETLSALA
jgi:acetylornithine/N-succinyldiaminopimelate aminotransferase